MLQVGTKGFPQHFQIYILLLRWIKFHIFKCFRVKNPRREDVFKTDFCTQNKESQQKKLKSKQNIDFLKQTNKQTVFLQTNSVVNHPTKGDTFFFLGAEQWRGLGGKVGKMSLLGQPKLTSFSGGFLFLKGTKYGQKNDRIYKHHPQVFFLKHWIEIHWI